jgi:DNA segregation ATPase FtsK/SpoIIIE-like protein
MSLLQRRLHIGYGRAARVMDQLEKAGILGPSRRLQAPRRLGGLPPARCDLRGGVRQTICNLQFA